MKQLVCHFKSHRSRLTKICLRCDRPAGICMLLCMVLWEELVWGCFGFVICCGCLCGGNLFYLFFCVFYQKIPKSGTFLNEHNLSTF